MHANRSLFVFGFLSVAVIFSATGQDVPAPVPASPPSVAVPAATIVFSAEEKPATPIDRAQVPDALKPWVDWALRDATPPLCPPLYDDSGKRLCLWPSRLNLDVTPEGASFRLEVEVFEPSWLSLPGSHAHWPASVTWNDQPVPVLEREGRPAIHVKGGSGTVAGTFLWSALPQQIKLPPEIGLLALTIGGQAQTAATWEKDGSLWLQRQASSEPADVDSLTLKVHSLLEDGIPLWFETRVDLTVSGKSREETLGSALPEGWQLAGIESPLPVAIDDQGKLKAQLRAGRWSIALRAFRSSAPEQIGFASGAAPLAPDQVLAYRASPAFRQAEIMGLPQIDVTQTEAPQEWRTEKLPFYRWETGTPFQLVERVRGAGERGQSPLAIQRTLWLDEDGRALTFQDKLSGQLREIRRLDAAAGHALGSVSVGGEPQLITHNPDGNAPGFEVRAPQMDAIATGRIDLGRSLPATGWQTGAEPLNATLHLPPGYRLFALLGADHSDGDWLTAWTLLDLFLLLLFTLAVFRLRGWWAAVLACVAFGLAYHEPGAPRVSWLLLLVPVALAGVLPPGKGRNLANGCKWAAAALLLLTLTPFAARQIQAAIFPQLERTQDVFYLFSGGRDGSVYERAAQMASDAIPASRVDSKLALKENLKADPKAIIQTGPGVPTWTWRTITFGWEGPVAASQEIRPILIPPVISRPLGVARVLCLVGLAAILLTQRRRKTEKTPPPSPPVAPATPPVSPAAAALLTAGVFLFFASPPSAQAQFPDQKLLDELRERLTRAGDAFPGAADIASAKLSIVENDFTLELEYHAGDRCAAPVPIPLTALVPRDAVFADGKPATVLRRAGQLWVLLPAAGIHAVKIQGRILEVTDWEWGFTLKPRRIAATADGWTVSGLRPDGGAEDQLLFARANRQEASAAASYDRPDTRHALLVEREIELGLVWRVRTVVRRLSPTGRAAALRVPLMPGENVISSGRTVEGGAIEVRLAPGESEANWEGELAIQPEITLATRADDTWTERWRLLASPVWNVAFSGLAPNFESIEGGPLAPLWLPWPAESATLKVSRPKAVAGAAVTIDSAAHTLNSGKRQNSSSLELSLRTSLGEDFPIALPAGAEIVSLTHDDQNIPVRKVGDAAVVPLKPGAQRIKVEWRLPTEEGNWTRADAVRLPVEAANVSTTIVPTRDRWPLFSQGPRIGPAFRFWGVLAFVLIAAVVLSRVPASPLGLLSWVLLSIGLTQVHIAFSLIVVGWLFLIHWRGAEGFQKLPIWSYNLCEVILIGLTGVVTLIFIGVASAGLLGDPEMYISGNYSSASRLNWYAARTTAELPRPGYWSVSIWWYRFAMLLWALWLAASLVRWLRLAWKNSTRGGHFRESERKAAAAAAPAGPQPPELPKKH